MSAGFGLSYKFDEGGTTNGLRAAGGTSLRETFNTTGTRKGCWSAVTRWITRVCVPVAAGSRMTVTVALAANVMVTVTKVTVGIIGGSSALLSEGAHSISD